MNALGAHPWELSFSYGRALQEPPLKAWGGQAANVPLAQQRYYQRARLNGLARSGQYTADMETA
jgi:fructose-bisphosphate aldolase class I